MINIEKVDHIGIRVTNAKRAVDFYALLGFEVIMEVEFDAVVILKNPQGIELNLIVNGVDVTGGKNILMDADDKYPGYTHVALGVESIKDTIDALEHNDIPITQGPVTFGDDHVSVFIRDPDRNVIELRGREQNLSSIAGITFYEP